MHNCTEITLNTDHYMVCPIIQVIKHYYAQTLFLYSAYGQKNPAHWAPLNRNYENVLLKLAMFVIKLQDHLPKHLAFAPDTDIAKLQMGMSLGVRIHQKRNIIGTGMTMWAGIFHCTTERWLKRNEQTLSRITCFIVSYRSATVF